MIGVVGLLICKSVERNGGNVVACYKWDFAVASGCDNAVFVLDAGLMLQLGEVLCSLSTLVPHGQGEESYP